jgi:L-alanine-DL-glutamate epimerase-like enolase superfamily enzyme
MKIDRVKVIGKKLPFTLVEVHTDSGLVGIGGCEAPVGVTRRFIEDAPWRLGNILLGRDPMDVGAIWPKLVQAIEWQGGLALNAAGALDMALWDLAGKAANVPLYKLFGGEVQSRVMVYASGTAFDLSHYQPGSEPPHKSPEQLAREAAECVRLGFRAVKFGWGDHFGPEDEARLAAIREAIGLETLLMIDFGCPAYFGSEVTPKSALRIASVLEKYQVYFLEEPLPPHDAEGHAELTRRSGIRIASGEMLCHGYEFDRFLDRRAVDVIQPDAYRIGVSEMLRVARRARDLNILCVPHSPWSALALAAHTNVLASLANGAMMEFPAPSLFRDTRRHGEMVRINNQQIVTDALQPQAGYVGPPRLAGLGVGQIDMEAVERIEALAEEGFER